MRIVEKAHKAPDLANIRRIRIRTFRDFTVEIGERRRDHKPNAFVIDKEKRIAKRCVFHDALPIAEYPRFAEI
jgi:hypothetical protein